MVNAKNCHLLGIRSLHKRLFGTIQIYELVKSLNWVHTFVSTWDYVRHEFPSSLVVYSVCDFHVNLALITFLRFHLCLLSPPHWGDFLWGEFFPFFGQNICRDMHWINHFSLKLRLACLISHWNVFSKEERLSAQFCIDNLWNCYWISEVLWNYFLILTFSKPLNDTPPKWG